MGPGPLPPASLRQPFLAPTPPRPLLRPVFRAPDPLSRVGLSGASTQPGRAEAQRGGGRCCDLRRCRLYQADWGLSEAPFPAFLTPGSAVLDPVAGHCQGWRFPGLRNFGRNGLPGALPWGLWVPGAGLAASFSFVYAGWQKSSGLLAGSGSSLLLNSFSMESLWAGVEGTGASSEAGLSRPLALSAMFLLSQNNSGGGFVSLGVSPPGPGPLPSLQPFPL